LAGDCDNHTCLGNEMCASFATGNVGHTCFPLSKYLSDKNCTFLFVKVSGYNLYS